MLLKTDSHGIVGLSDSELLQILLGNRAVAKHVLAEYGSLHALAVREEREFYLAERINTRQAKVLAALFEIARRLMERHIPERLKINEPEAIFQHFHPRLVHLKTEHFYVLALNSSNILQRCIKISEGILNATLVHPREVFAELILERAAFGILMHNHPSGEVKPSVEDESITRRLVEVGKLMNIPILDHVIIGVNQFYSFREAGLIE